MKLHELKQTIEETIGVEIIDPTSLIVCVNNCIDILHSKNYRHFEEITEDVKGQNFPIKINVPTAKRKILFVKIKYPNTVMVAKRLSLNDPALQATVVNGEYRVHPNVGRPIFYERNDEIVIDGPDGFGEPEYIVMGLFKKINKIPMDADRDKVLGENDGYDINVREEFEGAFTFFGARFFAKRHNMKHEIIEEYSNQFRYFVEDMEMQLDREDRYLSPVEIEEYSVI